MESTFSKRKNSILSKQDKSSKGRWDKRIVELCEKINKKENYYTTSSCSGRVVVMVDKHKKESDLFLKVWHNLIKFGDLKEFLNAMISIPPSLPKTAAHSRSQIDKKSLIKNRRNKDSNLIKFKQEPCIIHVACRTIDGAKRLLDRGRLAGWKKSGILSLGDKIVVELSGTEKLEFPFVKDGRILVDDDFLEVVVGKANENLKKSWEKIDKLEALL